LQPKSTKATLTSTGFKLFIKIQGAHKLKSISTGVKLALFVGSITLHPFLFKAILQPNIAASHEQWETQEDGSTCTYNRVKCDAGYRIILPDKITWHCHKVILSESCK